MATHLHRESDLLLSDQEGRSSELGQYCVRLRDSQDAVGFVTGVHSIDGADPEPNLPE